MTTIAHGECYRESRHSINDRATPARLRRSFRSGQKTAIGDQSVPILRLHRLSRDACHALVFANDDFLLNAMMIPFLIFVLAAIGLNMLTGYTGLLSLGTGAFMGVGAYACYKLTTIFPGVNILIWIVASGFFCRAVGVLFGLPSLRIKGFYLAVATLAAQFFLEWCFIRVAWLYNYNISGAIEVPQRDVVRHPRHRADAPPRDALPHRADHRHRHDLARLQPRAWPHRPACGWRCATWTSPPS